MSVISFADVVHQIISFARTSPAEALILDLIDTPWVQRLRDISQTANTRLVYMFSEHSRFGHCLGVAYLATSLLHKLADQEPESVKKYASAVAAAALLHDIGHLAPGSHTAYKTWFPDRIDNHEELAVRIIRQDSKVSGILSRHAPGLGDLVAKIITESDDIPPWTWEIISGGGWNVDRGNWCIVDSILAGVSYGKYNIPALTESIVITADGHLALRENRLDAMMHFAVSRHAMYRQIYQHRVLLAADMLNKAIVQRARDLGSKLEFADDHMRAVLAAKKPEDLETETLFEMREYWWRYHLSRWRSGPDKILADLSDRLLHRRLFKTVRITEESSSPKMLSAAADALKVAGFDPAYYLHQVGIVDVHSADSRQSMLVALENGSTRELTESDPLFGALIKESRLGQKSWLVMPAEVKNSFTYNPET